MDNKMKFHNSKKDNSKNISWYFNREIDTMKITALSNHKPGILNNYIKSNCNRGMFNYNLLILNEYKNEKYLVLEYIADVTELSRVLDKRFKRLVLQCINGVGSNSVEGRTNICQLKDLILILLGLIFRHIYIFI